jgi:hypothetical protein
MTSPAYRWEDQSTPLHSIESVELPVSQGSRLADERACQASTSLLTLSNPSILQLIYCTLLLIMWSKSQFQWAIGVALKLLNSRLNFPMFRTERSPAMVHWNQWLIAHTSADNDRFDRPGSDSQGCWKHQIPKLNAVVPAARATSSALAGIEQLMLPPFLSQLRKEIT